MCVCIKVAGWNISEVTTLTSFYPLPSTTVEYKAHIVQLFLFIPSFFSHHKELAEWMDERFNFLIQLKSDSLLRVVPKTQSACQIMCHGIFEKISSSLFHIRFPKQPINTGIVLDGKHNRAHRHWRTSWTTEEFAEFMPITKLYKTYTKRMMQIDIKVQVFISKSWWEGWDFLIVPIIHFAAIWKVSQRVCGCQFTFWLHLKDAVCHFYTTELHK